jgi:hypothetical protein
LSTINKQEHIFIKLGDFRDGINTKDPAIALKSTHAQEGLNCIFYSNGGIGRGPGKWGLNATPQHTKPINGLFEHKKTDGTNTLIAVSDADIDAISIVDGTRTKLFDIGGTTPAVAANAFGTLFIANSSNVAKVESGAAYQVGIDAPIGATTAKLAGGSLSAGVYQVAVSYGRKVSGSNVIYSLPQIIGAVTLSAGDLSIRVTVANSADAQVNNKIVWITGAGLTSPYYWAAESGNNTSTTIDVTSDTRNLFIVMDAVAAYNNKPAKFEWLVFFDNRIYGSLGYDVYWSNQAGTVYDLETFPIINKKTFPFKILSLFQIGEHIYVNTVGGVYVWPYGAPLESEYKIGSYLYFKYPYTVCEINGLQYGLTNDGVRYFDGVKFSIDLSKHIKPIIDSTISGWGTDFQPFGVIRRRSGIRTEYHLSYRDLVVSSNCHNSNLVLNLDSVFVQDNDNYRAAFENWTPGFSQAVEMDQEFYIAQSISTSACICRENIAETNDKQCINTVGAFVLAATNKRMHVVGRMEKPDPIGFVQPLRFNSLCKVNFNAAFNAIMPDNGYRSSPGTLYTPSQGNQGMLDTPDTLLDFFLPTFSPLSLVGKFDNAEKGKAIYFEIDQIANDPGFNIYEIVVLLLMERNNYS